MLPRVWHLTLARAETDRVAAWIEAGVFEVPVGHRNGPRAGDYVVIHQEGAGAIAAARVVDRPPGSAGMEARWGRFPRPVAMQGVPRGPGLRASRAFAWEQKRLADEVLGS